MRAFRLPVLWSLWLLASCGGGGVAPHRVVPEEPARLPARLILPKRIEVPPRACNQPAQVVISWRCVGTGTLRIHGVRGNCGCARVPSLPTEIRGGARGDLAVSLTPRETTGPQNITITVYTDRPAPDDLQKVRIRAWVGAPIAVRPASIDLGVVDGGFVAQRSLDVQLRTPHPVVARLHGIRGTVYVQPIPGSGRRHALHLRLVAAPPAGALAATVEVSAGGHRVRIPIRGEVLAPGSPGAVPR